MARSYDNSGRLDAARETRQRILRAAQEMLMTSGYSAMTIAALAKAAGVSPQTVYNSVGGKAEVLKATYDTVLAGDDSEVPMSERPEFLAMSRTPDGAAHARAYAAWTRAIYERVGPLLWTVLAHAGADPALEAFAATIETERRTGNTHMVTALEARHGLRPGLTPQTAIDSVWVLTAPETADRLMRRRKWSAAAYETWLGDHLVLALGISDS
ncbi:TetR/AcrR family transcriptional regulator [Nocardia inohanensis]|uniref:TetR/AcrR family transcriptional regulator n=1 Tax=Nocardia inohanensis TaxID=209246 RepID=UPI00082DECF8|nr:TetR/AcrR family transcriptional regulator [Nocardia inohanensis]